MRRFAVFLLLIILPVACAQEGLFVSAHNVTYALGENEYFVEEVIVFENTGSQSGNLFRDNIYFTRGDASGVLVEAAEGDLAYSVDYTPSTIINIGLAIWRGEKKKVTIKYNRSDMLFSEGSVYFFSGTALGKYSWIADSATVKFIAPEGFQFGGVVPPASKTIEGAREVLAYDVAPVDIENLTAIREGLPVNLEYAKFDELAVTEMITAREFIEDAESDISGANKSIENALDHVSDTTPILTLFEIANTTLEGAKNALDLAEIKSNQYSTEHSPYEAYYYAKQSRTLARESSRNAEEAKDLANYEIQRALEDKIFGIGSKLQEQKGTGAALKEGDDKNPEIEVRPWAGYGLAFILVLAAIVIFDIYRRSGGARGVTAPKKSAIRDFRAIGDLKQKTFNGFDKKLDTVKQGTGLATEIRNLRKIKEDLEFAKERLQRRKEIEEMPEYQFETENEKLVSKINETSIKIDELKAKLNELKKVNK